MTKLRNAALLISLCTALSLASAREVEDAISLSAVSWEVTGASVLPEVSTGGSEAMIPSLEVLPETAPKNISRCQKKISRQPKNIPRHRK